MTTMNKKTVITMVCSITALTSMVNAMDIGNSVPVSTNKKVTTEVYYEKYKRDVTQDVAWTDDTFSNEQEENRFFLRLKYIGLPTTALSFDIGTTESKHSEGYVPMLGAGISQDIFSKNDFTLSLFAKFTYVTEIEYKDSETYYGSTYYVSYADTYEYKRTEKYWEYGGGLQITKLWNIDDTLTLNTYAGILASFISSDGKETIEYDSTSVGHFTGNVYRDYDSEDETDVDFKEDKPVGAFIGVVLGFVNSPFAVRAETRLIDQTSFSVAAQASF